jgi:uncharacterized membrane protein YcaP (DUF421 family)
VDPLRIAVRALVGYVALLSLVRLSGKRTLKHGSAFSFTMALILGDMVDDLLWAEIGITQFVVASGTIVLMQTLADLTRFRGYTQP